MSARSSGYSQGYNVGVGGVVVEGERVLMVRRANDPGRANWQIPGGYCEREETLAEAVVREVREETAVHTEIQGVLGVRSRTDEFNSTYVVFLLRRVSGDPAPGPEVDAARFLTLEEIDALEKVPEINRALAARALSASRNLLQQAAVEATGSAAKYTLFVG